MKRQLPASWARAFAIVLLPSAFCLLPFLSGCNGRTGNGSGGVVVDNRGGGKKPAPARADGLTLVRPPLDEELPQLSAEEAAAIFRLIRSDALRKMSGELSRKTLVEFSDLELPESLFAQNGSYVIVSLYPAGGAAPRFGFAAAGTLGFSAAAAAYAALGDGDPAILKTARVKIDLASSIAPCGPDARLVPGVEGLLVANKGLALLPPDRFLDDSPTMKGYLRKLVERAGLPEGFEEKRSELMLAKFATTSALQVSEGAEPVFLYRGNALVEQPTAKACEYAAFHGLDLYDKKIAAGYPAAYYPYADRLSDDRCCVTSQAVMTLALYRAMYDVSHRSPVFKGAEIKWSGSGFEGILEPLRKNVSQDPRLKFAFVSDADADGVVSLGASALALVAFCERERTGGDDSNRATMRSLADFLLAQQTPDGEFLSHFDPVTGRPAKKLAEVSFPGQAILALVRLFELDGREVRFLAAAEKGAKHLVAAQRKAIEAGLEKGAKGAALCTPDAWLMQALDALTAAQPDAELSAHLLALADAAVAGQLTPAKTGFPDLVGGMDEADPPTVAMTAARGEGLLAALRTARRLGKTDEASRIECALDLAARYVVLNQWRPENAYALPAPEKALGGFRTSPLAGEMRPETTAHAALFLLGYAEAMSNTRTAE